MMIAVIKLRLRNRHTSDLLRQSQGVNVVWNYCNETQKKAVRARRKWLTGFDLQKLTAGSSRELRLHAHTVQKVCSTYASARGPRPWLRWRTRKSLGWVPFNTGHVLFDGKDFVFNGRSYQVMHSGAYKIEAGTRFGAGSFNADGRGCWYINLPIEIEEPKSNYAGAVGVDLGLKTLASLSDGGSIKSPRFYRDCEVRLAMAQRARKTKRARSIHAKARNRRKDFLHKASANLVRKYGTIVVGDVSPSKLAKTRMAKSVHDAGWAGFKTMLSYKALMHGGRVIEVNEAMSTQTCSTCGCLSAESRPKGIAGLGIREWRCDCGTVHDRDVNAACNILRVGLDTLAEGAAV